MRSGQVNRLRRPLRRVSARVADAPTVANAPAVPSPLRRPLRKVRFSEDDPDVRRQCANPSPNRSTVGNAQTIDWSGAKLIERRRVERILRGNSRKISGRGEPYNYLSINELFVGITRVDDKSLRCAPEERKGKQKQAERERDFAKH
jgi:hypothetical protein